MTYELRELCRKYQVCLPKTANELMELLQEKGYSLGTNKFRIEITTGALLEMQSPEIIEIVDNEDFDDGLVFTLFDIFLIAECFGFNESDFKWNSNQFITQVKNGEYLYGVADLEYWYTEALAQFIILNCKKKLKWHEQIGLIKPN